MSTSAKHVPEQRAPKPGLLDLGDILYLVYPWLHIEWMYPLARLRGRLRYHLATKQRAGVRQNLGTAFGQNYSVASLDRMTREFFEYQQLCRFLIMLAPALSPEDLANLVHLEGLEHLDEALKLGDGVVLLGSHLNSVFMFLAIIFLRQRGYDVSVAMPVAHDAWAATRLRRAIDRRAGRRALLEMIGAFYAQFNVRPIVSRLRKNGIVSQTGDGWHSAGFVEVDFLGRRLPLTTGMVRVAQMTGASVVPLFTVGKPPDRVRFVFEEPFKVENGPAPDLYVHDAVTRYAEQLERYLRINIPTWQHWEIEDLFDNMIRLTERSLSEKYEVQ